MAKCIRADDKLVVRFVSLILILSLTSSHAYGADSYVVASSTSMEITEHGICATVFNNGPQAIMVPTKALAEWTSFRTYVPPLVTLSSCCPAGYVMVPGDAEQGTSNFCVMQYEAKNLKNIPVSQPDLPPWNYIGHTEAAKRCEDLGAGYSLISNAQWQTVMRNAEYVNSNWSGGSRGVGCFMIGNSSAPPSSCNYDAGGLDYGVARNNKARHILSNGTVVWDFGANLAEYVTGSFTNPVEINYWNGGYPNLSTSDRVKFGSKGIYSFGSCGPADDTESQACGMRGFAFFIPSTSMVVRGGDYHDSLSDAFYTHWGLGGPMVEVGFRCSFDISQSQDDPCKATTPPAAGTRCSGGSKYAGTYDSRRYMVHDSGCNDSATPFCSGANDTITKTWKGTSGTDTDIPGLVNITSAATLDPNSGEVNTATMIAHSSVSSNSAAHWCNNLVYGGYDDWFLPNKDELKMLFNNRAAIGGFTASYHSSTEAAAGTNMAVNFSTATEAAGTKNLARFVRCVRRYN